MLVLRCNSVSNQKSEVTQVLGSDKRDRFTSRPILVVLHRKAFLNDAFLSFSLRTKKKRINEET